MSPEQEAILVEKWPTREEVRQLVDEAKDLVKDLTNPPDGPKQTVVSKSYMIDNEVGLFIDTGDDSLPSTNTPVVSIYVWEFLGKTDTETIHKRTNYRFMFDSRSWITKFYEPEVEEVITTHDGQSKKPVLNPIEWNVALGGAKQVAKKRRLTGHLRPAVFQTEGGFDRNHFEKLNKLLKECRGKDMAIKPASDLKTKHRPKEITIERVAYDDPIWETAERTVWDDILELGQSMPIEAEVAFRIGRLYQLDPDAMHKVIELRNARQPLEDSYEQA